MITALSACVGVSIRVSWCKKQHLVGKWWLCMTAGWLWPGTVRQHFPECSVVVGLWKWRPRLPPHPHVCVCRTVGLLNMSSVTVLSLTVVALFSEPLFKCPVLKISDIILFPGEGRTGAAAKWTPLSYMKRSLWLSHVSNMVATVYALSGGHGGKPFHRFCVSVRHSGPLHRLSCTSNESLLGLNKGGRALCNPALNAQ